MVSSGPWVVHGLSMSQGGFHSGSQGWLQVTDGYISVVQPAMRRRKDIWERYGFQLAGHRILLEEQLFSEASLAMSNQRCPPVFSWRRVRSCLWGVYFQGNQLGICDSFSVFFFIDFWLLSRNWFEYL